MQSTHPRTSNRHQLRSAAVSYSHMPDPGFLLASWSTDMSDTKVKITKEKTDVTVGGE